MAEKFYITTPIYFPSGRWHIGTCYTTVICDALARYKRMQGYDVFYLTGTDEHGQKIEKSALDAGIPTKLYVDGQVESLIKLWELFGISYDKFIRTTDTYHEETVKKIFTKLYEQGDIYKGEYEGMYCMPCESYWTKTQLVDGKCPDCGRDVKITKESSYFFKLSKYQDRLIALIENNPDFLQPKSRQNEMLNNFLKCGLQDLAVSRNSFKWGVEVPFDPEHVVYVWIDALTNYISALGYMSDDDSLFKKFWPADLHLMAKEIVRFHSIIWPALLMALDLPLPKQVYGHGWLLLGSEKISKSKGNIIDPVELSNRYSVDAIRYFLLREVPFGQDGIYSNESLLTRINTDLCNNLGNLVSRTTAMIGQYFDGILPQANVPEAIDAELINLAEGLFSKVSKLMDDLLVPDALSEIFRVIQRANKYIDETTPWILAKDVNSKDRLGTVLYNLADTIRIVAIMLTPFLIDTPKKILAKLSLPEVTTFDGVDKFGMLKPGSIIIKGENLFPRIDVSKELIAMEKHAEELATKSVVAKVATPAKGDKKMNKEEKIEDKTSEEVKNTQEAKVANQKETIKYDDFDKIDLKVGKILTAEKVAKSEKLLKFSIDIAGTVRTVVSGIAKCYTAEQMVGKNVVVVTNLAPVKLCGIMSEGMILCADGDNQDIILVTPEKDCPSGSCVR